MQGSEGGGGRGGVEVRGEGGGGAPQLIPAKVRSRRKGRKKKRRYGSIF